MRGIGGRGKRMRDGRGDLREMLRIRGGGRGDLKEGLGDDGFISM